MKKEKQQWFEKVALAGAKIVEVLHWGALVVLLAVFLLLFVPQVQGAFMEGLREELSEEIGTYGLRITLIDQATQAVNITVFRVFLLLGAIEMGLMAMVFRNVHLILRNAQDRTPFVPDNIRMLREIGIFAIAQPLVGLVGSVVLQLFVGFGVSEASVHLDGMILGVVALCLTQVFARGMELEKDTEGLL